MSHKIKWNGEILSLRKICKKEGISEYAVYRRISLTGENPKDILLYYLNQPNKGNKGREKIELNGQLLDVKSYCRELNYDYRLVIRYKASQPNKSYTEILKEWKNLSQDEILNNIHLYDIWTGMMDRCYNPKNHAYKWYGGKKVNPTRVYKKWQDYTGFKEDNWEEYTNHVKQYGREQTSIDREDENGDYCPSNCSWADWEQQGRNKSSTKYFLPCNNYQKTLRQHCKQNEYGYDKIIEYIKQYNLEPDKALAKYLKNKK